jgi:hypothetical protein
MNLQSFANGYSIEITDCTEDTTTFKVYRSVAGMHFHIDTCVINDDDIPAFIAEIEGK